jgi:HEAT repeat protein
VLGEIGPGAKAAVPALIEAMKDPDTKQYRSSLRLIATAAVGQIGPDARAAIPSLIKALTDDWNSVRSAAVKSLAGIGPAAIPALTKALQDKNPEIRVQAAEALGLIGPAAKPAIPALNRALKDANAFVVAQSALACWRIEAKTEIVLPIALKSLAVDDTNAWGPAEKAFLEMGLKARSAVPALCKLLKDKKGYTDGIVNILGKLGPAAREAMPALTELLRHEKEYYRWKAVWALGKIDAEAALPALTASLGDPEARVRWLAAGILGQLGPAAKPAIPDLIKLLADPELTVRASAAFALGQIGPSASAAVPALGRALKDEQDVVRWASLSALEALGPVAREALPDLCKLVLDKRSYLKTEFARNSSADVYQWLRSEEDSPAVRALHADRPATLPERAMRVLAAIGPGAKEAVPALLTALRDERASVRRAARATLLKIDPQAISRARLSSKEMESLWRDMGASEPGTAYRAMWALAAAPTSALPWLADHVKPVAEVPGPHLARLIKELDDPRFAVRQKAAADLADLHELAEPALRKHLQAKGSLEHHRRIEVLLKKLETGETPPEQLRARRSITVLKEMGTSEAVRLLTTLSRGAAASHVTQAARKTMERLGKKEK